MASFQQDQQSGFVQLAQGHDAFAARMMLVENAVSTLDIQYYIWEYNLTGRLLFEALVRAAERGVAVRLLLDDNNTARLDQVLARLQAVDGIDIRLFNPMRNRRFRLLNYVTDFHRVNRRMHNKSLTADEQASIIGGRNIGDAYFNAGRGLYFIDLDVLVTGAIVRDISADFDKYWSCPSSLPVGEVMGSRMKQLQNRPNRDTSILDSDPEARAYLNSLKQSPYGSTLSQLDVEKTQAQLISDDPAKGAGKEQKVLMQHRLSQLSATPEKELLLVAPYFIPGRWGTDYFKRLRRQGVEICVLTNAFEATDVPIVHTGYRKYRKELLKAGVRIYELKQSAGNPTGRSPDLSITGRSRASLHAKTFSIDREKVYVGSHNFDPRSTHLNTEMGALIDSRELAEGTATIFEETVPPASYEVRLGKDGKLEWIERSEGEIKIHQREPGMAWYHKIWIYLVSKLPIEWLL